MRKLITILLFLCLLTGQGLAQETQTAPLPAYPYTFNGRILKEHVSQTLKWRTERFFYEDALCYLTKVWMADPGRQIGKTTADWRENVQDTMELAQKAPAASLLINASGYVTRTYSWIPKDYPGKSSDYFFTPLGSLTVTDGEVFRCLEGVPYYGLTLNTDGLRLHIGEDPAQVLAQNPAQTWSFYVECPVIADYQSILDPEWKFTNSAAMRTIIAKMDQNNYVILTVTRKNGGLTMQQCVDFLLQEIGPEWAYNLDGGPSSALMYRDENNMLRTIWKNGQENVDIMTFSELAGEE